ncbi:glucosamine-6-phosphate deaminase [Prolixibacteraceae bacterium Z1-6]|uniref:Glucosamine-6-phosphate deaminase n=1 Tax=Draconibacterium aestuarii TaxID=2998507 RepID=A0A9X3F2K8_9BACT|nr:glucosamine-6-phosphate deaminase [Prolixibacteraceae bacterium Z1-6]
MLEYKLKKDKLNVEVYSNNENLGEAAAVSVAEILNQAVSDRGNANLILATGASQFEFLKSLQKQNIEWGKVTVFHLDEYKDLPDTHPASFRKYLKERILTQVKPGKVYLLNGDVEDLETEISNYEELLRNHPIDVACIGIGENGHLAFNDPPVADFNDPKLVKIVELDNDCRMQQYNEGWFESFDDVPKYALSLTIPAIMQCKKISCVVPDERKAKAVFDTINTEISTKCPATILRTHPDTVLYLDKPAASLLDNNSEWLDEGVI